MTLERHYTPTWAIKQVAPYLPLEAYTRLLDPSCGDGAMQRAFPDDRWLTNDIDKGGIDGLEWLHKVAQEGDLVWTNPPFSRAFDWWLDIPEWVDVCFLLPVTWIQAAKRGGPLSAGPPDALFVHSDRLSFYGPDCSFKEGQTDSKGHAWYYWGNLTRGIGVMPPLPKEERTR